MSPSGSCCYLADFKPEGNLRNLEGVADPRNHFLIDYKRLRRLHSRAGFVFGRIWAQNSTQLLRKLQIILARNVRVRSQRQRRITVPYTLQSGW